MAEGAAPALRRAMGLRTAVSTSAGLAFAALEYLAAAGLVAYVAGDAAWIAIGVAGLLALLAWACFGELNGMFPTAAAIRIYMQRAMDDRVALVVTFTYMTTIVLVIAADAFIVGAAVSHVLHESTWFAALWIAALLAGAVVANLRRLRVAGAVQDVATFTALGASAVTATVALVRGHHALRFPLQPLHGHSFGSFVAAVALGVFLYSAFEWVTTNAEEVRVAHIHLAMLAAVGILFCVCSLMTVAMSHVLDHGQLTSAFPQLSLGSAAFGGAGLWVMAAVTAVTALNTFNGGFITVSRFVYATAGGEPAPRPGPTERPRRPLGAGGGARRHLRRRGRPGGGHPRLGDAGGRRGHARGDDLRRRRLLHGPTAHPPPTTAARSGRRRGGCSAGSGWRSSAPWRWWRA